MNPSNFTVFLYCDAASPLVERMASVGLQAQRVANLEELITQAKQTVILVVDGDKEDLNIQSIQHSFRTRFPHRLLAVILWAQHDHPQRKAAHVVLPPSTEGGTLKAMVPPLLEMAKTKSQLMVLDQERPEMDPAPILDSVVHHLNNVLGVLIGYLDILGMQLKDESQVQSLSMMKDATADMGSVLKHLGALMPARDCPAKPVALELIIDGGIAYARHVGGLGPQALSCVDIHYQCPKETQVVTHGPTLIQGLGQVLQNAYESYPEGTQEAQRSVVIEATVTDQDIGKELRIAVKDSGPGLDASISDKAHEAFVTTKPGRKGLGLPVARQSLRAVGGQLIIPQDDTSGLKVVLSQPFMPPDETPAGSCL